MKIPSGFAGVPQFGQQYRTSPHQPLWQSPDHPLQELPGLPPPHPSGEGLSGCTGLSDTPLQTGWIHVQQTHEKLYLSNNYTNHFICPCDKRLNVFFLNVSVLKKQRPCHCCLVHARALVSKTLSCLLCLERYTELSCFSYHPNVNKDDREEAWSFIDLRAEYGRMGIPSNLWYHTPANSEYRVGTHVMFCT